MMFVGKRMQWMPLLRIDVRLCRRLVDAASLDFKAGLSSTRPGPSPLQKLPTVVAKKEEAQTVSSAPAENGVARAFYRQLPTSVKKLTPVAKLVRKMRVEDALLQCDLIRKKGAVFVQNAIRSARANGVHNDGLDPSKLFVEHCFATNGRDLKRIKMHGRGKFGRMKRRRTHLTVILREDPSARPSPHRIIDTWMQRQLKREQGVENTAGLSHREMKAHAARVKWTTQLRRMRLKEREKLREAKRQIKHTQRGTKSTLKGKKRKIVFNLD